MNEIDVTLSTTTQGVDIGLSQSTQGVGINVDTSGLATVHHDDTLVGEGTNAQPLGVNPILFNTFVFEFDASQSVWEIEHNLGKHPSITVVDSAGTVITCTRSYPSDNVAVIEFNAPFKGTAYLN